MIEWGGGRQYDKVGKDGNNNAMVEKARPVRLFVAMSDPEPTIAIVMVVRVKNSTSESTRISKTVRTT